MNVRIDGLDGRLYRVSAQNYAKRHFTLTIPRYQLVLLDIWLTAKDKERLSNGYTITKRANDKDFDNAVARAQNKPRGDTTT
jgi:hypothetical protein